MLEQFWVKRPVVLVQHTEITCNKYHKRYSASEKLYYLGGDIMLSPVFEPFIKNSPISVMARGMLERVMLHKSDRGGFFSIVKPIIAYPA